MTSILQVCDLVINKPVKQRFKQLYTGYKIRADPGAGGIVKAKRDDVLTWLETSFIEYNEKHSDIRTIAKSFKKCGQDFRVDGVNTEFVEHIQGLSENAIYKSLIENQTAVELD